MSLGLRTFEWSLHCITKELELQVREVAVPARLQTLERGFSHGMAAVHKKDINLNNAFRVHRVPVQSSQKFALINHYFWSFYWLIHIQMSLS